MAFALRVRPAAFSGTCDRRLASATRCHDSHGVRRRLSMALIALPMFGPVRPALALIPDDEDEELIEKAKANRKARLAQQQTTTRAFLKDEGITDLKLGKELVPVQQAVTNLAISGSQLDKGDLPALASTLSDDWVDEFSIAAKAVSKSEDSQVIVDQVMASLASLKSAAASGDVTASKKSYVEVVASLQSWATQAGVAPSLKGL